jgi:hypothetical protein
MVDFLLFFSLLSDISDPQLSIGRFGLGEMFFAGDEEAADLRTSNRSSLPPRSFAG